MEGEGGGKGERGKKRGRRGERDNVISMDNSANIRRVKSEHSWECLQF